MSGQMVMTMTLTVEGGELGGVHQYQIESIEIEPEAIDVTTDGA